ncbi:phage head morphogenesis protein [Nevskia ramosa]|uniref:phage head morphogenesis protein n=1 Tax=Nevskia ramosa TaxID=64002 RepID=UPI0023537CCD|nr:phage minor head protein [Nevskia ramosa]
MSTYGSLPFKEQIAFFRQKLNLPTESYADIQGAQHDQAFVVAGAMKADLLTDLRTSVDRVVADGIGFEAFKADFRSIAAKHGWAYNGGANWRAQVIYETNLNQSYNAGREAQMADPALRKRRPFGMYKHYASPNERIEHVAWDGMVVPLDDPWWASHSPANGWGCKCKKFMVSQRDVERRGLKVTPGPAIEYEDRVIGKRSGNPQTVRVPKGIDPGFQYAPGRRFHPNLDKYPEPIARGVVAQNLRTGVFERWHQSIEGRVAEARRSPDLAKLPKGELLPALRKQLGQDEQFAVATLSPANRELLGVETQTVYVSDYDVIKQAVAREGQELAAADYLQVQAVIDEASVVIRESDAITVWVREGERYLQAVLQQTVTGKGLYLKSFRRSSPADLAREKRRAKNKGYALLKDSR